MYLTQIALNSRQKLFWLGGIVWNTFFVSVKINTRVKIYREKTARTILYLINRKFTITYSYRDVCVTMLVSRSTSENGVEGFLQTIKYTSKVHRPPIHLTLD